MVNMLNKIWDTVGANMLLLILVLVFQDSTSHLLHVLKILFHITANITELERSSEIQKRSCPEVPMPLNGFSDIGMWHN